MGRFISFSRGRPDQGTGISIQSNNIILSSAGSTINFIFVDHHGFGDSPTDVPAVEIPEKIFTPLYISVTGTHTDQPALSGKDIKQLVGNGDDILDPGEVWEWVDTAPINRDAYFEFDVVVDPVTGVGSRYGFSARSAVVRVS